MLSRSRLNESPRRLLGQTNSGNAVWISGNYRVTDTGKLEQVQSKSAEL